MRGARTVDYSYGFAPPVIDADGVQAPDVTGRWLERGDARR